MECFNHKNEVDFVVVVGSNDDYDDDVTFEIYYVWGSWDKTDEIYTV